MYVTCYSTMQLLKGTQKAYKYGVNFLCYTQEQSRYLIYKTCVITLCMYARSIRLVTSVCMSTKQAV